ncbi:MAG: hypothetical protein QM756_44810 [Polyangiaceae bacterium]
MVGYFTSHHSESKVLDGANPGPEARKRTAWAVSQPGVLTLTANAPQPVETAPDGVGTAMPAAKAAAKSSLSSAEILRKLNRAQEERQQTQQRNSFDPANSLPGVRK